DYGWTRPRVISRGPVPQGLPTSSSSDESAAATSTEELPTAEPTLAQPPVDISDVSPLPPPQQETRSQPRIPAAIRPTVAPAAYIVERGSVDPAPSGLQTSPGGNPLRSTNRPVGTGVVNP